jgi:hypothetical protein
MSQPASRKSYTFDKPGNYRIRVNDFLDESWSERLAGLRITSSIIGDEKPVTVLVGQVRDQAELAGVLNTLYELHLTLLSAEYLSNIQHTNYCHGRR